MGRIRTLRHLRAASPGGLNLDFTSGALDGRITASGGANGTVVNSSGVLVAANAPRFDYNPSTLSALGLLVEEARTNSFRNNTMVGGVGASPGTPPTNWTATDPAVNGLVRTLSYATINGIATLSARYVGTATSSFNMNIVPETTTVIAASNGQTWALSAYVAYVKNAGTDPAAIRLELDERDAVGAFLAATVTAISPNGTLSRFSTTRTNNNASTAFEQGYVQMALTSGVAYDFTITVGLPQLELGAFATSVIQTSGAAVTRTADSVSMTGANFSQWFNASAGTLVAEADIGAVPAAGRVVAMLTDATIANAMDLRFRPVALGSVITGLAGFSSGAYTPNVVQKMALAYATNDFAFSPNGAAVSTLTGTLPAGMDRLFISDPAIGYLNGHIRRLRYFPSRLPNASLQSLTA